MKNHLADVIGGFQEQDNIGQKIWESHESEK
jgi:hypothetical protein